MKHLFAFSLLFFSVPFFAQNPCEYNANQTDSLGTYKETKQYMISEKNFAGNSSYIFFSLTNTNGIPTLNVQLIQKNKGFIKALCFDKNSKLFLQLNNGKIVSFIHIDQENCGTRIQDDKGFNNRINTGTFVFSKDNYEALQKSPASMMRIKYLTDTEDFIFKKEFESELNGEIYYPENYFIEHIKCIE